MTWLPTSIYPIALFDHERQGIAYILEYVRVLELETTFINALDIGEVRRFLKAYGLMYRMDYRQTVMNLFEPIFYQCIFSVLARGKVGSLFMTASQYAYLKSELESWGEEQLHQRLMDAFERLLIELELSNEDIKLYMACHLPSLERAIINAVETGSCYHLIVTDKERMSLRVLCLRLGIPWVVTPLERLLSKSRYSRQHWKRSC
jgi:hypothetical protein